MSRLIALITNDQNWSQIYQCANFLLNEDVGVLWAQQPFTALLPSGDRSQFERGTLVIKTVPIGDRMDWLSIAEQKFDLNFVAMDSMEDFEGLSLKPLRIAIYGGGGAPFNHARILVELGFKVDFITPHEIRQGALSAFDIIVMPGGGELAMKGQLQPLGEDGCRMIREFVRQGGLYMGSCAGSYDAAIVPSSFLSVCPQQRQMQLVNAAVWNHRGTVWEGLESPGIGVIECRNLKPDHPVMFGLPESFHITHYNGPFFEPQLGAVQDASESIGLASVVSFTEHFTPSEYFLHFSEYKRTTAVGQFRIGQAILEGRFNIMAGHFGQGRVVLFGSHPEFGYNLAMDRLEIPARMLANTAFWQAGHLTDPPSPRRESLHKTWPSFPLDSGLSTISQRLDEIVRLVAELKEKPDGASPDWMADRLAISAFGLSGKEIWHQGLRKFDDIVMKMKQTLTNANDILSQVPALVSDLRSKDGDDALLFADVLEETLHGMKKAVFFQTPTSLNQDFGYEGVVQMLERTEAMLRKAHANFNTSFELSTDPYKYSGSSPYLLVVGSYLSALGILINAWSLLWAHVLMLSEAVFKGRTVLKGN